MYIADKIVNQKGYIEKLRFSEEEHPVVVQIGGSDPATAQMAAILCEQLGYDEININCGCPSKKVQVKMSSILNSCWLLLSERRIWGTLDVEPALSP
jgi:tRNA-dihydrouridine synthase